MLIQFSKDDCPKCVEMKPVFERIGKGLKNWNVSCYSLEIYRSTHVPENSYLYWMVDLVMLTGFPSYFFIPGANKTNPAFYDDTLDGITLLQWIQNNSLRYLDYEKQFHEEILLSTSLSLKNNNNEDDDEDDEDDDDCCSL